MQHPIPMIDRRNVFRAAAEIQRIPIREFKVAFRGIRYGLLSHCHIRWHSQSIAHVRTVLRKGIFSWKAKGESWYRLLMLRIFQRRLHVGHTSEHDRLNTELPMPMIPSLAKYDALIRYRQTSEEAELVASIGRQLRHLRKTFHLSREALAAQLDTDLELLLIVENGDGNPETALHLLERTKAYLQLP